MNVMDKWCMLLTWFTHVWSYIWGPGYLSQMSSTYRVPTRDPIQLGCFGCHNIMSSDVEASVLLLYSLSERLSELGQMSPQAATSFATKLRKPMQNMQPWYRGFAGTIKPSSEKGVLDHWKKRKKNGQVTLKKLAVWGKYCVHGMGGCQLSSTEASMIAWEPFPRPAQRFSRLPNCLWRNGHRTTKSPLEGHLLPVPSASCNNLISKLWQSFWYLYIHLDIPFAASIGSCLEQLDASTWLASWPGSCKATCPAATTRRASWTSMTCLENWAAH